ncbi:hypothetical protein IAD21_05257 [Abditibacteriota bacterium]|nr:hypothetical protein IAD21_05257 [Abditibacteriota bacterium]
MNLSSRLLLGAGLSWAAVLILHDMGLLTLGARSRENRHNATCQSNLKQLGFALLQYTQDYGEFPAVPGNTARFGWVETLRPYLNVQPPDQSVLQCPAEANSWQRNPKSRNYTDYWFNAHLSRRNYTTVGEVSRLLIAGDGNDGSDLTDGRYSLSMLPYKWVSHEASPLYSHLGRANYLFADGHAKALNLRAFLLNGAAPSPS